MMGIVLVCSLYTYFSCLFILNDLYGEAFGGIFGTMKVYSVSSIMGHATISFIAILLIIILKIIFEKLPDAKGSKTKIASFLSKKLIRLVCNFLLFMSAFITGVLTYNKYMSGGVYENTGGNLIVDCVMLISIILLMFTKKVN